MQSNKNNFILEFRRFFKQFEKESDRAIVILTAAKLDYLLERIIEKFIISTPERNDPFFEIQGPAGTFYNKIILAFRLGLIDNDFTHQLHKIRKLRNEFAHEVDTCSFKIARYKDIVVDITSYYKNYNFFIYFQNDIAKENNIARKNFTTIVGILILRLEGLFENIGTIPKPMKWEILTKSMKEWSNDSRIKMLEYKQ